MNILNLTQHTATPEQIAQGVINLPPQAQEQLCELLTFNAMPTVAEVAHRAMQIAHMQEVVAHKGPFMIGGAPYLMPRLERLLQIKTHQKVLYAFTQRESVEQVQPDGGVRKVAVFRHAGFVGLDTEV